MYLPTRRQKDAVRPTLQRRSIGPEFVITDADMALTVSTYLDLIFFKVQTGPIRATVSAVFDRPTRDRSAFLAATTVLRI